MKAPNVGSGIYLYRLQAHLADYGVDIHKTTIQSDNGSDFSGITTPGVKRGFVHEVENVLGANHGFTPPSCPNANADVEAAHALIKHEFFDIEPIGEQGRLHKGGSRHISTDLTSYKK